MFSCIGVKYALFHLLCFPLQANKMAEAGIPLPNNWYRISYFHCSLLGYFLGLLTATISSEVSYLPDFETAIL